MNISIKNKKASFNFLFIEEFVAGIVLVGTEIKSIRNNNVSFTDSFCYIKDGEIFLKNVHIAHYKNSFYQHEEKRDRKLLLTKKEIKKIKEKKEQKGLTIVPVKLFINEKGLAKVVIALAKGKNTSDKRADIKEKDIKKEIQRELINY